jgi:hypothetical protein
MAFTRKSQSLVMDIDLLDGAGPWTADFRRRSIPISVRILFVTGTGRVLQLQPVACNPHYQFLIGSSTRERSLSRFRLWIQQLISAYEPGWREAPIGDQPSHCRQLIRTGAIATGLESKKRSNGGWRAAVFSPSKGTLGPQREAQSAMHSTNCNILSL